MEKFVCTHCGNHFEHEPAESILCPKCYWSTSVKKEKEETQSSFSPRTTNPAKTAMLEPEILHKLWIGAGGLFFVLLLIGIALFALRHLRKQDEFLHTIETKNAQVIAAQAPELALTPEQQEILNRAVSLEAGRPVTQQEKETLAPRFSFRSRGSQGVPTPPWNEKEFDAFIKNQETQFQLPLEWSYRRKLKQLFSTHYVPAARAFEAKDHLKARDEWIRSLAFPIYQNDVQKHRAVILTMFRPFINDTLAKIGSMNASLVGNELFALEGKIKSFYDNLIDLLQKGSWEEANAKILELKGELAQTEKLPKAVNPPALPKELSLVDQDIREVLLAQVAPAETSAPDWDALRGDLASKERVIQSHLLTSLDEAKKQYESALLLIKSRSWEEAKEELKKIEYPEEYVQDAQEKLKVLDQLTRVSADTQKEK